MYQSVDEEQAPNPADVVMDYYLREQKIMPMQRALKEHTMSTLIDISIQQNTRTNRCMQYIRRQLHRHYILYMCKH